MPHPIDNSKIESIDVRWKSFKGVTTLLRNPCRLREKDGLEEVRCDIYNEPSLALYAALARATDRLKLSTLLFEYSVCVLPPETYHVTLGDGVNPSNILQFGTNIRGELERFLEGLPGSLRAGLPQAIPPNTFRDEGGWRLRLRFAGLSLLDQGAIVARLEPVGDESLRSYEHLCRQRTRADAALITLGKDPLRMWSPHISLAYLANGELAARASTKLTEWESVVRAEVGDQTIEFTGFDLCCFLDMVRFFVMPKLSEALT